MISAFNYNPQDCCFNSGKSTHAAPAMKLSVKKHFYVLCCVCCMILPVFWYYSWDSASLHTNSQRDHKEFPGYKEPCSRQQNYKAWESGVITPFYPVMEKNCSRLIAGDEAELKRVEQLTAMSGWVSRVPYTQLLTNCSRLKESLNNNLYISKIEEEFPIAFTFVVHDSPEQFLRLLRVLYRPGDVYCIHPDQKSLFREFFVRVAECFPNIITASHAIEVSWGTSSLLDAQMHCLSDLHSYRRNQTEEKKWKYVINLCGKELPLVSVREIVDKLKRLNNTSSVVARPITIPNNTEDFGVYKRLRGKTLPHNLVYHKSLTFTALSEPFINFLLHNQIAKDLYTFLNDTKYPEEHFYATLFKTPGVPGGYSPNIPGYFQVEHCFWQTTEEARNKSCHGETVHKICVVNFQDLPRIMRETQFGKTALFHNKYFMELDHVIMDCMEERIVAKNKREFEMDCLNS
jgi:hypothetical protein